MIDLTINEKQLPFALEQARERGINIPTFEEMIHPESIQESMKEQLKSVGLWEVNPLNLFLSMNRMFVPWLFPIRACF